MKAIKPFNLSIKTILASSLVLCLLPACGAKGPLYQAPETELVTPVKEKVSSKSRLSESDSSRVQPNKKPN